MTKQKGEKKWFRPTYPAAPPDSMGSWRTAEAENRKRKKTKTKELKPFNIRHYRFFPCSLSKHLKGGYVYYLVVMDFRRRIKLEIDCPVFKTREEAAAFADSNALVGLLPA
jgi:hypothetical protein